MVRGLSSLLVVFAASCGFPELPRLEPRDAPLGDTGSAADAPLDTMPDSADGCTATQSKCGGSTCLDLTTDTNCGQCGIMCTGGSTCHQAVTGTGSVCCPAGQVNCNGQCVDTSTDEANCGACAGAGGSVCSGSANTCCGGTCTDVTTDEANCGACAGMGGTTCSGGTNTCCNGTCTDVQTDEGNCGACAGMGGTTCSATNSGCCGGSCADLAVSGNCGMCGTTCTGGDTCKTTGAGTQPVCCPSTKTNCNGTCVDLTTNTDCGACGAACNTGAGLTCTVQSGGGNAKCCPSGQINCSGVCVDPLTNAANCGGCAGAGGATCGGSETCNDGHCCGTGKVWCPSASACIDSTATCCGFGRTDACSPGICKATAIDSDYCGVGCSDCTGTDVCLSGGCKIACPAPLTNCPGEGDDLFPYRHCANTGSDNENCGTCGNDCPSGQGCTGGLCVSLVIDPPVTPSKCAGGGPAIYVPTLTAGGGQTCTGNLGAASFLFALCARTAIGPLSQTLTTDAFDSSYAPYVGSCTLDLQCSNGAKRCKLTKGFCTTGTQCTGGAFDVCDYPIKCVAGTCAGGGVGVNGRNSAGTMSSPLATDTATTTIGGDFWTFGTVGLSINNNMTVKQRLINGPASDLNNATLNGPLAFTKASHVYGDAIIKGGITATGSNSLAIDGILTTQMSCAAVPPTLTATGGCTMANFPNLREPCGAYDNSDHSVVPVATIIVPYFRETARNDNALIGLKYDALDNPAAALHLDLPCGVYYLNSITTSQKISIAVHGRTALIVGGAISVQQTLTIDVDPTASLDLFVGGVLTTSNVATFGSPLYPRLTRVYLGSASCSGSGSTCDDVSDCCGGRCSACPTDTEGKPTAACAGSGTCVGGGGNKSQSMSVSGGGYFNGLFWAGAGTFTQSIGMEIYGSLNANYFDASGGTTIHYDDGAALLGRECPAPTTCQTCRNCNGQACILGVCTSCTGDADCCAPLRCVGGTCTQ